MFFKLFNFNMGQIMSSSAPGVSENTKFSNTQVLNYSSFEKLNGETPNRSDDVFGAAVIEYELLTGKQPYDGVSAIDATEQDLRDRLGSDLVTLLADEDGDGSGDPSILVAALDDASAEVGEAQGAAASGDSAEPPEASPASPPPAPEQPSFSLFSWLRRDDTPASPAEKEKPAEPDGKE